MWSVLVAQIYVWGWEFSVVVCLWQGIWSFVGVMCVSWLGVV